MCQTELTATLNQYTIVCRAKPRPHSTVLQSGNRPYNSAQTPWPSWLARASTRQPGCAHIPNTQPGSTALTTIHRCRGGVAHPSFDSPLGLRTYRANQNPDLRNRTSHQLFSQVLDLAANSACALVLRHRVVIPESTRPAPRSASPRPHSSLIDFALPLVTQESAHISVLYLVRIERTLQDFA